MASETFLTAQIEASKSSEKIENEVKSYLNEAKLIMKNVKDDLGKDHEMYQRFEEEYDELRHTIKTSLDHGREFSKQERMSIMLELGDIIELADDQGVDTSGSGWSHFSKNLFGSDTNEALDNVETFLEKDISEYSIEEAQVVLEHLNKEYGDFEEGNYAGFDEENISDLADKKDINVYQERLITKILGENHLGFNEYYIQGYNSEKGNYITEIADFESTLKDRTKSIHTINSLELANYFSYLAENNLATKDYLYNILGTKKINELGKIWENNSDTTVLKVLEEYNLQSIVTEISNYEINNNLQASIDTVSQIDYDLLDINYLLSEGINGEKNYQKYISNITNPNTVLTLLDRGAIVTFDKINKDLIYNTQILERIDINFLHLNRYSVDGLLNNKNILTLIIQKDINGNGLLPFLINRLKTELVCNRELKNIFKENIGTQAKNSLSKSLIDFIYFDIDSPDSQDIDKYIEQGDTKSIQEFVKTNGTSGYEISLIKYVKNGGELFGELFLYVNDKRLAEEILNTEDGYKFIMFIPNEIFEQFPHLLNIAFDKMPLNMIKGYLHLNGINSFESLIYLVQNIENKCITQAVRNDFYDSSIFRNQMIHVMKSNSNFSYLEVKTKYVKIIENLIQNESEQLGRIKDAHNAINNYLENQSSPEKINILKDNISNIFFKFGIEISQNDENEILDNLMSNKVTNHNLVLKKVSELGIEKQDQSLILDEIYKTIISIKQIEIQEGFTRLQYNNIDGNNAITEYSDFVINNPNKTLNDYFSTKKFNEEDTKTIRELIEKKDALLLSASIHSITQEEDFHSLNNEELNIKVKEVQKNITLENIFKDYNSDEYIKQILIEKYVRYENNENIDNFLNIINEIDDTQEPIKNKQFTYSYAGLTYEIPDIPVNNTFSIINYQTGEKIEISQQEKETVENNPEALKNLIDTKQKLEMLGLEFVWNNREEFLFLMKNDPNFNDTGKIESSDNDYLNISEFNHLLQFVLYKTTGDTNTNDYFTNMSKIRQLNGENELNEKRNFISGLSNIGQKFVELGFLTESGTLNFHWVNTKNYSDISGAGFQKAA